MDTSAISTELSACFPIDERLTRALDRWQTCMPGLLLRAAVLEDSLALASFGSFKSSLNLDNQAQQQLIGQLHRNIGSSIDEVLAGEFKAVRLSTLVNNKLLFRELEPVADCLARAGIPVMALKGAGVAPTYYADIGCRPMSDLDLLVPEEDINQAAVSLAGEGWRVRSKAADRPYFDARFSKAISLRHQTTFTYLDLHCHINHRACWPGVDLPYWNRAVPLTNGSKILRLSDSDNLMQVCVHGIAQNHSPPVRWAMDAYQIIKTCGSSLEWGYLVENARRVGFSPELLATLRWLQRELDADIPAEVFIGLKKSGYSGHGLQVWSYSLEGPRGLGEVVSNHWHLFGLATQGLSGWAKLALLPAYFKNSQNCQSFMASILVVGKKLGRYLPQWIFCANYQKDQSH
jgi:hypothetical protein